MIVKATSDLNATSVSGTGSATGAASSLGRHQSWEISNAGTSRLRLFFSAHADGAVKNLDVATDFYRNTLGLKPVHQEGKELIVFQSGHSSINVYRSEYAGTNKATAVTWTVDSIEEEVKALRNKGIVFEHYDMPGMKREGDIYMDGGMKVAWFKDPDGNILNVVGR